VADSLPRLPSDGHDEELKVESSAPFVDDLDCSTGLEWLRLEADNFIGCALGAEGRPAAGETGRGASGKGTTS